MRRSCQLVQMNIRRDRVVTVVESATLVKLESVIKIVKGQTMPEAMRKRLIEAIEATDEGESPRPDDDKITATMTRLCHRTLLEFTGVTDADLAPTERRSLEAAVRDAIAEL